MATTKATTRGDKVARLAMAGPGHRPTRPQPTPNRTAPAMSGRSRAVLLGHALAAASTGFSRRRATANPGAATASAPIITKASVGSQVPEGMPSTSRKPSTLVGWVMPEMVRPKPKIRPQASAARTTGMASASQPMARERDDRHRGRHEYQGGDDRAGRQARHAAHPMAGRAAAAEPGAE